MKIVKMLAIGVLFSVITACTSTDQTFIANLSFSAPLRIGSTLTATVSYRVPEELFLKGQSIPREQISDGTYDVYAFLCNQCSRTTGPYSVLYPATANPLSSVLPQGIEITNSTTYPDRTVRPLPATYDTNTHMLSATFQLRIADTVADLHGNVYIGGGFMIIPRGTDPNDWQKGKSIANSFPDGVSIVR